MHNTDEILHAYCRNILISTDGLVYNEPYLFPDTTSNKSTPLKKPYGNTVLVTTNF